MTLNKRGSLRPTALAVLPLVALIVAGCGSKANNDTFDLSVTPASTGPAARGRQILVPEPTALKAIDSNQVVVRVSPSEIQYLANSQWSDTLPRMVQSKLVAAFENSGRLGGVGKPGQGLAIDYQIVAEIRAFEVNTVGADAANVEIFVKILNDRNGTVRAQRAFQTSVPVSGSDNRDFVQALNAAFAVAGAEIVEWSLQVM
ncbi:ABC-type transport auxiliary lipoprotein family protein [Rhizobium halophilum]|uniref:ABC-type transport auxiliary lipoprotein family protein n=1 Tax=Rhizobium halophilum TaxID=2846852 RepID=UPI001EFD37AC|nr:ABC-type transport auxiliary lipoprotein family protein [Rhizobium halophilum]MCF6368436.1 ABC-type transport auxiliary lipoprotein family protein [Rhizobium halophilum]